MQIETEERTHDIIVNKITWLNDCEYELRTLKTSITDSLHKWSPLNNVPLHVTITFTGRNCFVFTTKVKGIDFTVTGTMWRIGGFSPIGKLFH
ncbi:MAG TPA: hypothetical protein VGI82_12225 [Chitinophagaceae bacterium]